MTTEQGNQQKLDLHWTISNALSTLRIGLVVPAVFALNDDRPYLTIGIFLLAAVTDVLDGYLARRLNEVSDLGKILDPLADKVFIGVVVIQMLVLDMLPLWFVAVVLGRDLLILLGGIYVERKQGVVLPSNYPGKAAVVVLSVTLLAIVAGINNTGRDIMMAVALVLLAISLYLYGTRAVKAMKN